MENNRGRLLTGGKTVRRSVEGGRRKQTQICASRGRAWRRDWEATRFRLACQLAISTGDPGCKGRATTPGFRTGLLSYEAQRVCHPCIKGRIKKSALASIYDVFAFWLTAC
jgi:hypothetical protein